MIWLLQLHIQNRQNSEDSNSSPPITSPPPKLHLVLLKLVCGTAHLLVMSTVLEHAVHVLQNQLDDLVVVLDADPQLFEVLRVVGQELTLAGRHQRHERLVLLYLGEEVHPGRQVCVCVGGWGGGGLLVCGDGRR